MQRLVVSTDDVREAERFSYWIEQIGEGLVGVSAERNKDQDDPFSGRVAGTIGETLARIRYRCDGYQVFRRRRDIARRGWGEHIFVIRDFGVTDWLGHDGRESVTRQSDLMILDPTVPASLEPRANFDAELWFLPRNLFYPHLPVSHQPRLLVQGSSGSFAGMVNAYLDAFAAQLDALDDREAGLVADNFCRLLAVACGAAAGEHQEAVRLARLAEAKRHIDLNLADTEMTPEKAAAALKMSVRQLHLLFEPTGTSFAQYVLRRRLEECRAALLDPVGGRSVTDIALRFGFNSLWTFNRTFRRAFGVTPSELRGGAAAPRSSG
jgi:AraC-like DNA-binding protein